MLYNCYRCRCMRKQPRNAGRNKKPVNGMQNRAGCVAVITSRQPPSINWKCFCPKLLIRPPLIKNWVGPEGLGFNVMRVYLHHLLWTADKEGFKKRLDTYLNISSKHGIKTLFVIFDDCWNDTAWVGKQPAPKPGIHNSGWVRDPGTMIYRFPDTIKVLEAYVKDLLTSFKNDARILMWDLYNEPGNNKQFNKSMPLLQKVFQWAREVNPSQPVTAGIWNEQAPTSPS